MRTHFLPEDNDKDDLVMRSDFIRYLEEGMNDHELQLFSDKLLHDQRMRSAFASFMRQQVQITELLQDSSCAMVLGEFEDFSENTKDLLSRREIPDSAGSGGNSSTNPASIHSLSQEFSGQASPPGLFSASPLPYGIVYTAFTLLIVATLTGIWWRGAKQAEDVNSPNKTARHETKNSDPKNSLVHIDSNTVRVPLPNIGYAIIEGPAVFEMVTPMLARLTQGRVNVHVTEESGADFVVETPHGNIKNLGTECDLNVSPDMNSGLVVRDGSVNLELCSTNCAVSIKRLSQGEGVTFDKSGNVKRVVSIVKGSLASHLTAAEISNNKTLLISDVSDSLRTTDTNKFYEIVPCGLKEDAPAYADRTTSEWNGVSKKGIPSYLIGADYVKTFNDNKLTKNLEISVTLAHPATLYIFYDGRLSVPEWLQRDFQKTGDKIGIEVVRMKQGVSLPHKRGPGKNIYGEYSIWERKVTQPGVVKLGPNMAVTESSGMYGIAAVKLQSDTESR